MPNALDSKNINLCVRFIFHFVLDFPAYQFYVYLYKTPQQVWYCNYKVNFEVFSYNHCWQAETVSIKCYRCADKSLARPGRKQATVTQLFCKPLKNNSEICPSNQVSAAAMTSVSGEKWRLFNCFLSRVGLRTHQHPCISLCLISLSSVQSTCALFFAVFDLITCIKYV